MRGAAAIVGFAEMPTRRTYEGRTAIGLMAEASRDAMADAGIRKEEIDGLVVEGGSFYPAPIGEYMGLNPNFVTGVSTMGASGATATSVAAMAIYSGLATTVLVTLSEARQAGSPWGSPPFTGIEDGI